MLLRDIVLSFFANEVISLRIGPCRKWLGIYIYIYTKDSLWFNTNTNTHILLAQTQLQ